jgi:hypothetical protein
MCAAVCFLVCQSGGSLQCSREGRTQNDSTQRVCKIRIIKLSLIIADNSCVTGSRFVLWKCTSCSVGMKFFCKEIKFVLKCYVRKIPVVTVLLFGFLFCTKVM